MRPPHIVILVKVASRQHDDQTSSAPAHSLGIASKVKATNAGVKRPENKLRLAPLESAFNNRGRKSSTVLH